MNTQTRSNVLQAYQVVLYGRALHPELFTLKGRQVRRHGGYEVEGWIMPGSHLLRFELNTMCACELVTDQSSNLPDSGVVTAFLCAGERDFEHRFTKDKVNYLTTVQTEKLSDNLYAATFDELSRYGRDLGALMHTWNDESGPCMSILAIEPMRREVHAQGFHLLAQGGVVLRTQSICELV